MKAYVKLELCPVIRFLALKGETMVRIQRELERVNSAGCIDVLICMLQFGGNAWLTPCIDDNARAHSAARTQEYLCHFGWTVLDNPSYSPDFVPSDYRLFPALKKSLDGVRFTNNDELVEYVKTYIQKLPTAFYEGGISKLLKGMINV